MLFQMFAHQTSISSDRRNEITSHWRTKKITDLHSIGTKQQTLSNIFSKTTAEEQLKAELLFTNFLINTIYLLQLLTILVLYSENCFQIQKQHLTISVSGHRLPQQVLLWQKKTKKLVSKSNRHLTSTDWSNDREASILYPIIVRCYIENQLKQLTEVLNVVDCGGAVLFFTLQGKTPWLWLVSKIPGFEGEYPQFLPPGLGRSGLTNKCGFECFSHFFQNTF